MSWYSDLSLQREFNYSLLNAFYFREFITGITISPTDSHNMRIEYNNSDLYSEIYHELLKNRLSFVGDGVVPTQEDIEIGAIDKFGIDLVNKFKSYKSEYYDSSSIKIRKPISFLMITQSIVLAVNLFSKTQKHYFTINLKWDNKYYNNVSADLISDLIIEEEDFFIDKLRNRYSKNIEKITKSLDSISYAFIRLSELFRSANDKRIAGILASGSNLSKKDYMENKHLLGAYLAHERLKRLTKDKVYEVSMDDISEDKYIKSLATKTLNKILEL